MNKFKFTKTAINKIQPDAEKQTFYWDTEIKGFGLRVSPGGTKTYWFQGRLKRKTKKITIGRTSAFNAEQARDKAKTIERQLARGIDPVPKMQNPEALATFGDLMTAYADLLKSRGKSSAQSVQNAIKKDIQEAFPKLWSKPAREIDLEDCMEIVGKINNEGKPRQADKVRSYIRAAFADAINSRGDANLPDSMRRMKIMQNPARDVRKVKGSSKAKDRALSLAELKAYWKQAQKLPEPKRSVAMLHVLTGGQRQEQLRRVTLSDIDRDAPSMTIYDTKGRRDSAYAHVVPLTPEALQLVDNLTGTGEYVFSSNGGLSPMAMDYLRKVSAEICATMKEKGKLEQGGFTAGVIRATGETRLLASGVSSDVLARLFSHGLGGVQAKHYQKHDFFEEKFDALTKLRELLG